ncbi:MAG TPA: TIGR02391 family protein [Terriglobales bacterium]|nr:TIGR02391 family protein [Terriglobales bacterium]
MRNPKDIFPAPKELLALPPEDVAAMLLEYLIAQGGQSVSRYNLIGVSNSEFSDYIRAGAGEIIAEAWSLLVTEGFLAQSPSDNYGMNFFITRRGRGIRNRSDFRSYRLGNLLPAELLDPVLAASVRPLFLRGDYDTAVFRAFREVEERVRLAGGFHAAAIGVNLMRDAFKPQLGPLADKAAPVGEQEMLQHLFAGTIGTFKNPSSHRAVTFAPQEAATLVLFANYLLSVVQRLSAIAVRGSSQGPQNDCRDET